MQRKKPAQEKGQNAEMDFVPVGRSYEPMDALVSLYNASFPDSERKPFEMILNGIDQGRMEGFAVEQNGRLAGLSFVILGDKLNVLDYLAVDPSLHSKGIGTRILSFLNRRYDKPVVVEIESTADSEEEDAARRKAFYLRNGFNEDDIQFDLFGVPMELLSSKENPDFETYYDAMEAYFDFDPRQYILLKSNE